eukprot:223112_1
MAVQVEQPQIEQCDGLDAELVEGGRAEVLAGTGVRNKVLERAGAERTPRCGEGVRPCSWDACHVAVVETVGRNFLLPRITNDYASPMSGRLAHRNEPDAIRL